MTVIACCTDIESNLLKFGAKGGLVTERKNISFYIASLFRVLIQKSIIYQQEYVCLKTHLKRVTNIHAEYYGGDKGGGIADGE